MQRKLIVMISLPLPCIYKRYSLLKNNTENNSRFLQLSDTPYSAGRSASGL